MAVGKSAVDERKSVIAAIDAVAARGGITRDRAITAWYASTVLGIDEDEAIDAAAVDGPEDSGCDFIYVDDDNEVIYVLQGYVSDRTDRATPKRKWDALVSSIANVRNPVAFKHSGRDDIYNRLKEVSDSGLDYAIVLGLIALAGRSEQVERACQSANDSNAYPGCDFFVESQELLYDKYLIARSAERAVEEDIISFTTNTLQIKGGFGEAFVGSLPASELSRLYEAHGERLFEGNVRLFIGNRKGGINEKIIETAQSRPGEFWALNNGITIVADRVEQVGEKRLKVSQFSIVNGCQTTVSLSKAGAPAKNAQVLARIVLAKKALLTDIVRFTNTQNAVRLAAVRLVDPLQEALRGQLDKVGYKYAPKQEGARSTKASDRIELERIAQYLASISEETVLDAVSNKRELFDRHYRTLFSKQLRAEQVLLVWLLANEVERERARLLADQGKDPVLRAVLGIHGTPWSIFVAYRLIEKAQFDLTRLNLAKMVDAQFKGALAKYAKKSVELYAEIASTLIGDGDANPRNEIRVKAFLDKLARTLSIRMSRYSDWRLPKLENILANIKVS